EALTLDRRDHLYLDHQPRVGQMTHFDHRAGRQIVLEELLARRDDLPELPHVRRVHGRPHDVRQGSAGGDETLLDVAQALPGLLEHAADADLVAVVVAGNLARDENHALRLIDPHVMVVYGRPHVFHSRRIAALDGHGCFLILYGAASGDLT